MRLLGESLDFVVFLQSADDDLHTELRFENLRLLGIANERGDIEAARVRVLEETGEHSAA